MTEFPLFYKTATSQNCVEEVEELFSNVTNESYIESEFEVTFEGMVDLHNHMNSSNTWGNVTQWDSGIYYTIHHPDSDITACDLNKGENTSVFTQTIDKRYWGSTGDGTTHFTISRYNRHQMGSSLDSVYIKNCKWVKIESKKSFEYESERSSWVFSLIVLWEGESKKEAENSVKRYIVNISPGVKSLKSPNTGYVAASFMEKIMDSLFKTSRNRHIMLRT